MAEERSTDSMSPREPRAMVGIGASAGGLEAVSELLTHLSPATGLAFLVVQHLDRTHSSFLADILAKKTSMPVLEAQNGAAILPDHVYVITPNTGMIVSDSHLIVTARTEAAGIHMPTDALFNSLAMEHKKNSIGVILSGTGSDGATGMQAIKGQGGITFAQDETSAKFDGMPHSAIDTGCVDFVLTPAEIAKELERIASHPYLTDEPLPEEANINEDGWKRLFRLLRAASGVDFSHYKRSTIHRRLVRRLALKKIDTLSGYLELLQDNPAEVAALYQDFLIRVTGFFRDAETFDSLASDVFPRIMQGRAPNDPIRIWVPGCSTGEEVYSIAIVLLEFLGDAAASMPIQIFGTDVNGQAIDRARAGRYIENIALDMSEKRLQRFFVKVDDHYEIVRMVRDLCVFAEHNVTRDPPFSRLDLVSCRNLLIYLDQSTQKKVMTIFHYALKPERFLMLGPSESIGQSSELFELRDKKRKLYQRAPTPSSLTLELPPIDRIQAKRARVPVPAETEEVDFDHVQRESDRRLLTRFAPPAVVIDERMNVLQFRGRTGLFLEHQQGAASLQLQKLIRPEILVEVSTAIAEARRIEAPVRREGLRVEIEGGNRRVDVEVIPLWTAGSTARCYTVLFELPEAVKAPSASLLDGLARWFRSTSSGGAAVAAKDTENNQLRHEIEATRAYLQSVVESSEATQEELRSANEEVLSANEEFQSTNEELETAKEELQSANEELATTNEELRIRNLELSQLNADLRRSRDYSQAIVETVGTPLLLLDNELRVHGANRAFYEIFRTTPAETDRCLFTELGDGQWRDQELKRELLAVLRENKPIEQSEVTAIFPKIGERTIALNAHKLVRGGEEGDLVLLSLHDVTEHYRIEALLKQQAGLLDQAHDAILVWEVGGPIRYWNRGAEELYGWTAEEAVGKSRDELLRTHRSVELNALEAALDRDGRWSGEQLHTTRDGRQLVVESHCTLIRAQSKPTLVLETSRDLTERKKVELALRQEALRKDEFLAMLSHELRNPLAPVRNALRLLRDGKVSADEADRLRAMIERQIGRLARIVDDLLDVARISHGQIALRKEEVDLVAVINKACESIQYRLDALNDQLALSLPDKPLLAVVDPERIEQVVLNLLDNAAKYSPEGSRIELELSGDDTWALIRVRDNGIGMPSELLSRVFDLFARGDNSRGRAEGGLGIGLTLVQRLVEMHGGSVQAQSAGPGRGSEFSVTLPRGRISKRSAQAPAQRVKHPEEHAKQRRVLVVDDNPDSAETLALLARTWGHEVQTAPDGYAALEQAAEFAPDVVLLDIGLPGMDGYEVARRLRELPSAMSARIFGITGYGMEKDRQLSKDAGIDDHLVKPIDIDKLEKLLQTSGPRRAMH